MKHTKKITIASLSSLLLLSSFNAEIFADEASSSKEEVIYVMTDASGKVLDTEVVNIFAGGNITDYGDYSAVKILNTTDTITQSKDKITFSSSRDKVYYQGTLKDKNIPWNISIRYFLNGKEYSAEDIAGKSGSLEIRFSISENSNVKSSFYDDYALQASFTLDTEKCKNISSSGATIANVGSDKQLTYTILPGKGIDTVIKANVTDFEMDAVSINGVSLNLNIEVDDEVITEKVNDVVSAVDKVNDGANEVNDGARKLADAMGSLSSGLSSINANNSKLTDGAYTAYEGLCSAATTALNSELSANGLDKVNLTPSTYSEVLLGLLKKLDADAVYNKAYNEALNEVTKQVEANADALYRGYIDSQADSIYLAYITSQAETLYTQVATQKVYEQLIQSGYTEDQAKAYLATEEGQAMIAQIVSSMTDEQKEEIIQTALASLTDEQKEQILEGAVATLTDDQKAQIKNTYIQQMMASEEVTSQISAAVATVSAAAKQVSDLKGQLDNFGVFYNGLVSYTEAVSSAASGASEIKVNTDKLYDGTTELAKGTKEFANKTSGIDTEISDEVNDMVSSISKSDAQVVSFVSDKNTNVTSVQFVIKTSAIEKVTSNSSETEETVNLTFIQKLLRLFNLY